MHAGLTALPTFATAAPTLSAQRLVVGAVVADRVADAQVHATLLFQSGERRHQIQQVGGPQDEIAMVVHRTHGFCELQTPQGGTGVDDELPDLGEPIARDGRLGLCILPKLSDTRVLCRNCRSAGNGADFGCGDAGVLVVCLNYWVNLIVCLAARSAAITSPSGGRQGSGYRGSMIRRVRSRTSDWSPNQSVSVAIRGGAVG